MDRFTGTVRTKEVELPEGGGTVLIRMLTAAEAHDLGIVSSDGKPKGMTGSQVRGAICLACREPRFVDTETEQPGALSYYALGAVNELHLLNEILDFSYGSLVRRATSKDGERKEPAGEATPFPAGGGADSPGVGDPAGAGDAPAAR